ncbi:MAG TPA: hypothetical protein VF618_21355 [Thermoanaerobaculia bacterium]
MIPTPIDLPKVQRWSRNFEGSTHLVFAGGFEDVCGAFLDYLPARKASSVSGALAIRYLPFIDRNETHLNLLYDKLAQRGFGRDVVVERVFDRMDPHDSVPQITEYFESLPSDTQLCVDISGMSRLLLLVVLNAAMRRRIPLTIVSAVAKTYEPSAQKYEAAAAAFQQGSVRPEFLCREISKTIALPEFGGMHDVAFPTALVAFAEFNYKRLAKIVADGHFADVVQIVPVPSDPADAWRVNAIRAINRDLITAPTRTLELPADEYVETLAHLEALYRDLRYSHNITVAALGTKLQTVACWLLHAAHPEIQIVFTAPVHFEVDLYTRGVSDFLSVDWTQVTAIERATEMLKNPARAEFIRLTQN